MKFEIDDLPVRQIFENKKIFSYFYLGFARYYSLMKEFIPVSNDVTYVCDKRLTVGHRAV